MTTHTAKGEEARRRILDAAAELMHLHGVQATSVDRILERAGAGKGQFYHYFRDKDELVRRVVELQGVRTLQAVGADRGALDSWDAIRGWMDRVRRVHRARDFAGGCPVGSVAAEMTEASDAVRRDLVQAFEALRRPLADGLRAMRDEGRLRDDADPDRLARFTVAALQGGLLLASTERREAPLRDALEEAYAHLRSFATR